MNNISKKYLSGDSLPWLMEDSHPVIRYLTVRDILNDSSTGNSYDRLLNDTSIQHLLKNSQDGLLGDTSHYDVLYKGSMWFFSVAVEHGLDIRTPEVLKTGEYLLRNFQLESGGFTINWKPRTALACRTGDMLKYLLRSGISGPGINAGIQWIIDHQRHDGGWLHCPLKGYVDHVKLSLFNRPGSYLDRESDVSTTSCFYATISCLNALLLYTNNNKMIKNSIHQACEFLLRHRMFKTSMDIPIKPRYGWNRDFRLLGYPVMMQYDILHGLIAIARAGHMDDMRAGEAFNIVISKQNTDGSWNLETASNGMLMGDQKKPPIGVKSKWVTLNAHRLLQYL
jgi:hypothetical protein